MWLKVTDEFYIRCTENAGGEAKYTYEYKTEEEGEVKKTFANASPLALTSNHEIYRLLKPAIEKQVEDDLNDDNEQIKKINPNGVVQINASTIKSGTDKEISKVKNLLNNHIVDESAINQERKKKTLEEIEREIDEKYQRLYAQFIDYRNQDGLSALEEVISIAHCLGVGNPREIVKAWIGFFQTYIGYKGTNVIAVGSPASGKSFLVETALSMIPEERVHKGVKSVAYFFRKYNQQDLTGHVFYLGDLGGERDNEDTIALRDLLKQLTTDGYVERGVIDNENKMSEEEQWVKGYPALAYTTANEDIINDQEKSRSIILTPSVPSPKDIAVFKAVRDNQGNYKSDFDLIDKKKESVKGLVHHFKERDYDFFNPYMFTIAQFIESNDDFNRKIDEYMAILKLVTVLNNPKKLTHNIYSEINDMEEEIVVDTDLVLASKRDNINALNVFSYSNLLPDEIKFANGVIENFHQFEDTQAYINIESGEVTDINSYESNLSRELTEGGTQSIDVYSEYYQGYAFTMQSLKKEFKNNRWLRKSRKYIQERLDVLYEEGIIIKIGSTSQNEPVYGLNYGMDNEIHSNVPTFLKSDINLALDLFKDNFTEKYLELQEFLEEDTSMETENIFEIVKPTVLGLPFNKD